MNHNSPKMITVYRSSDNSHLGPYSLVDVRKSIMIGSLKNNDLATYDGILEWKRLDDVVADLEMEVESLPDWINKPLASTHSNIVPVKPRTTSFLFVFGIALIMLGLVVTGFFLFVYDPSVAVQSTYVEGYGSVGGGRVNNFGLLQDRQNGIICGIGLSIIGSMLALAGHLKKDV